MRQSFVGCYFIANMQEPKLNDVVIFICQQLHDTYRGIIINQLSPEPKSMYGMPLYYGGPHCNHSIVCVHSPTKDTVPINDVLHLTFFESHNVHFSEKPESCFFASGYFEWHIEHFIDLLNAGVWIQSHTAPNMIIRVPPAFRAEESRKKASTIIGMPPNIAIS